MRGIKAYIYGLLRRSERIFKTDMVYLAEGGFWLGFSQVVVSLSSFFLAVAFAHLVSKESYGQYKYVLSIVGILSSFTLTGLGTAIVRSVSHGFDGTIRYAFRENIKWSFLFSFGFFVIALYYFINGNFPLAVSLLIVGLLSPLLKSTNFYNSFLAAKKDFRRSALYYGIAGNVVPFLCLFIVMFFTSNPLWLVSTYFISNTAIGLILYSRVLEIYKPNREVDPEALHYSKHLSFLNILSGIANNIDQVLVFHYIGAAQLAIYNFAIAIPNQAKALPANLSNIMFPKFAVRDDGEIRAGMNNKYLWLFILGVVISIVYILIAPALFHIFFPTYTESIRYSQISILPMLCIVFEPAASYLTAKGKIKEQYISNLLASIFQIVSVFVGIIWWGLMGLVIARVVSRFFANLLMGLLYEVSSRRAVAHN
jgi:O-antigen/teichoic acid export membrane protein